MNEREKIEAEKEYLDAWMVIFAIVSAVFIIGIMIAFGLFVIYGWLPILTRLAIVLFVLVCAEWAIIRYIRSLYNGDLE